MRNVLPKKRVIAKILNQYGYVMIKQISTGCFRQKREAPNRKDFNILQENVC